MFGRVQVGTVYTGGTKIAEHGGDNPGDREVPLLVYAPGMVSHSTVDSWVETTQVAPTILDLLGAANYVRSRTYLVYEPLLFVAAGYLVTTLVIERVFRIFERRFARSVRAT